MDFQLGADVRRSDATKVGEIQRMVVDLETGQLTGLVVLESRVDGYEVLVPIGLVNMADDGGVDLEVDQDQFESLEAFTDSVNVAPPPDAANVAKDEVDDPVDVPDVLPVGAATGIESIAFTPVIQQVENIQTGEVALDGETTVYATDGEVGRVLSLRVDGESERVESILTSRGLVVEHLVDVPWSTVRSVQDGAIVLAVARAELRNLDDV